MFWTWKTFRQLCLLLFFVLKSSNSFSLSFLSSRVTGINGFTRSAKVGRLLISSIESGRFGCLQSIGSFSGGGRIVKRRERTRERIRREMSEIFAASSQGQRSDGQITGMDIEAQCVTTEKTRIRVYCISDLHADAEKNQMWVKQNCNRKDSEDIFTVMVLPGDIGTEVDRIGTVFDVLTANYDRVCFVPGNHELWRRGTAAGGSATRPELREENSNRMAADSLEKMKEVLALARSKGVTVGPLRVQLGGGSGKGVLFFPLYSWYHSGWDTEPNLTHPDYLAVEEVVPFARKWGDFNMCSWPEDIISPEEFKTVDAARDITKLADAFAQLNEPFLCNVDAAGSSSASLVGDSRVSSSTRHDCPLAQEGDTVISFSHFLPREELCPEKRFLIEPLLTRVIGSRPLEAQIRRLRPHIHCFGHTHIPIDLELEGIRYVQWSLGYSSEADKQCAPVHTGGALCIFDSVLGSGLDGFPADSPSADIAWTAYYLLNNRKPHITDVLSPWLQRRLESFAGLVENAKKTKS